MPDAGSVPRGIPKPKPRDPLVCQTPPWDQNHLTLAEVAEFERLYRERRYEGDVSLCVPTPQPYDLGSTEEGMPSGRWSLLDMMNWSLQRFGYALTALSEEICKANAHIATEVIADEDKDSVRGRLQYIADECRKLALAAAEHRLMRCFFAVDGSVPGTYGSLTRELVMLSQAIDDDIRNEYFYHYPRIKARLIVETAEWQPAFVAFPSTRTEIEEGIDSYALGHNAACGFHMMRTAELGMRALARERQVTFPKQPMEWAEWGPLIDQIEAKAKAVTSGMARGPEKDAALSFYTSAISTLRALKETRNRLMHTRGRFDDLDAQRAMNQVRDFMTGLARKIGEKTRTPIRRWP